MNAKKEQQMKYLQVTEGLTVAIAPNASHQFIMTTAEVAHGYDCDTSTIRQTLSRNSDEFIEGKHFLKGVTDCHDLPSQNRQPNQTYWTKRGIVRLGFFLKCGNAKLFRDWAEDLILSKGRTYNPNARLHEHEKPLFDVLTKYLVRGDITLVALELEVQVTFVSRVRTGVKKSKRVMEALIKRCNYNMVNNISNGYKPMFVQHSLDLFNNDTQLL